MRKLSSFTFISLDGFYKGNNHDISWHNHGEEESKFSEEQLSEGHTLIFGRVTYEMMFNFWTSPMAHENFQEVARKMNEANKIVFSKTLQEASWNNTTLIKNDAVKEIKTLKQVPGKELTILGSGTIIQQFAQSDLIDEYKFMIDPIVLGEGTPLFSGLHRRLALNLDSCASFRSGVVLLQYSRSSH